MGFAVFLMGLSWTLVSCVLVFFTIGMIGNVWLTVAAVGVMVLGYVFLSLFASALNGIYTAALYRYAMTGDTGGFDSRIMGNAFRPKK
jgi:hypothetical protein